MSFTIRKFKGDNWAKLIFKPARTALTFKVS